MNFQHALNIMGQSKYLLDGLTSNLAASYSVTWKVRPLHIISCRVRRSNDNAELDIGFVNGELDVTSLLSFCGTNSGYIVKLYDGSGNGNTLTQIDIAKQPRIVNAGIIDRDFDVAKCNALYPTFQSAASVTLIREGNFPDASEWTSANSTLSIADNMATVNANGTSNDPRLTQNNVGLYVNGKKIFVKALAQVDNSSCLRIEFRVFCAGMGTQTYTAVSNPVANTVYECSGILTLASGGTGSYYGVQVVQLYADSATANGKVLKVQEVFAVDITNYGKPCLVFDGSNDCLIKPIYPSTAEAALLYPTFNSASSVTLLNNGLPNDLTGWYSRTNYGTLSIVNGWLRSTKSTNLPHFVHLITNVTASRRIFISLKARGNKSGNLVVFFGDGNPANTNYGQSTFSITNTESTYTGIITISGLAMGIELRADGFSADGDYVEVKELICVDVTDLDTLNITNQPLYLNAVYSTDSSISGNAYVIAKNIDGVGNMQYALNYNNTGAKSYIELENASRAGASDNSIVKGVQTIQSAKWESNSTQIYDDGVASGSPVAYSSALTSRANFTVGARSNNAGNTAQVTLFKGKISELHIMRGNPLQSSFEAKQKQYYNIA